MIPYAITSKQTDHRSLRIPKMYSYDVNIDFHVKKEILIGYVRKSKATTIIEFEALNETIRQESKLRCFRKIREKKIQKSEAIGFQHVCGTRQPKEAETG